MSENPTVTCAKNGPLLAKNLETLEKSTGESIETRETIALCRCGESSNKPFCDGTHAGVGFSGEKEADRTADAVDTYVGDGITILDNRGVCCHAGACTDGAPEVWRMKQEPWIDPDGASAEKIAGVIGKCPSGALNYVTQGVEHVVQGEDAAIRIAKDGPYLVTGPIEMEGLPWGAGALKQQYALCRCGKSRNKPFCDGTHWAAKFSDPDN
jgi:CDGSH-type Zn-finger protein